MKRKLVIFDGSNFFHRVKALCSDFHLTNFDHRKLAELICGDKDCLSVEYCIGEIKMGGSEKTKRLYDGQQKLFYNLGSQRILIKRGVMLKTGNIYHEKGVDVRIAIDILRGALKNEYDICYVVSSDMDLVPAIKDARRSKKDVIYVGFENSISNALQYNSTKTFIITKDILNKCKNNA